MLPNDVSKVRHGSARGFTLVEVLVTLVVFSILSISGITILSQSIAAKGQADAVNQTIEQLRRTHTLLKSDLAQVTPRQTRDRFGARSGAVFEGGIGIGDQPILQFVRDGWDNPSGLERRSSLQKVEYRLEGTAFVRRAYMHLDHASADQSVDLVLLEDVTSVDVSFFVQGQWYSTWAASSSGARPFPHAVAVTLRTAGLGEIRQVFQTSGLSL